MSNIIQLTNDLQGKATEEIVAFAHENIEHISSNGVAIQNIFKGIDEELSQFQSTQTKIDENDPEHIQNHLEETSLRKKATIISGLTHQKNALARKIKKSMSNIDKGKENISGALAEKIEITLDFINGDNPERFSKLFDKNNPYYYLAVVYIISIARSVHAKGKDLILKKLTPFINTLSGVSGDQQEFLREAQYICSYFVKQTSSELDANFNYQSKIDEMVTTTQSLLRLFQSNQPIDTQLIGESGTFESFNIPRKLQGFVKGFIIDKEIQIYLERKINSVVLGKDYSDDKYALDDGMNDKGHNDDFDDILDS